jgi:predicted aldo/keto reductase-like oxidoreductase
MTAPEASAAMTLNKRSLGAARVATIGFGAMRLTGPGVFGPPSNREEAILLLREAVDSGVDHLDIPVLRDRTWSVSAYPGTVNDRSST